MFTVTPCVGVWIETKNLIGQHQYYDVTPCVGVWIETQNKTNQTSIDSHTLRGCVDWNIKGQTLSNLYAVTPCVGVWIETSNRL